MDELCRIKTLDICLEENRKNFISHESLQGNTNKHNMYLIKDE